MTRIFISYRRDDSEDITGRIGDRLRDHFGSEFVFSDVDDIPIGRDFRKVLDEKVGQCSILLAIIGKRWLLVENAAGSPRLHDETDFVRLEIESALRRDIVVVPVLVQNCVMPASAVLPESLQELSFRHAAEIRSNPNFHNDVNRLIRGLELHLESNEAAQDYTNTNTQLGQPSSNNDLGNDGEARTHSITKLNKDEFGTNSISKSEESRPRTTRHESTSGELNLDEDITLDLDQLSPDIDLDTQLLLDSDLSDSDIPDVAKPPYVTSKANIIRVPTLPESIPDALIVTWHKAEGELVSRDEVLVDIETDKVVLEVPAAADGTMGKIIEPEGTTVIAHQVIGSIVEHTSFSSSDNTMDTMLDLAKAYIDMSDIDSARSTLNEIVKYGRDEQILEATSLIRKLSKPHPAR